MNINDKVNCLIFGFVLLVLYLILKEYRVIEGFSETVTDNSLVLQNIASLYNNKSMTIDNLKVTGNIEVDGYAKAKAFALTGQQYTDAEAKAIYSDGIFYRSEGQAVIGMDDNLYIRDIGRNKTVTINSGNLTVPGKLTVQGGSDFSGGRHYFKDSEKSDGKGLRVGAAWGRYGIYSENGSLALGSQDANLFGNMRLNHGIAGYAVDGDGSSHLLYESRHSLVNGATFDAWSNDRWDKVYVHRGWKITCWRHEFSGTAWVKENKTSNIPLSMGLEGNQITSYQADWVGYD